MFGTGGKGLHRVSLRWLRPEQVSDEVIPRPARDVVVAAHEAVFDAGDGKQVEIFLGVDEGVDEVEGLVGQDVVVELAVDEQKLSGEIGGEVRIGGVGPLLRGAFAEVGVGPQRQVVADTLGDGSVVQAPILVNAAGPWSSKLNRLAGIGGDFTVEVAPLRQEVHHVPAPLRLGDDVPIIADADLGIYVRPDAGGNLLIGGTEPACDPLEWIDDPGAADPNPTVARFEAQILRGARRLPDLGVPNRPRGIAGVYDAASDRTPIYDRTESDGYFVAMGTSGNQFKNAPLVGSLMLAIIEGVMRGHDHDADPITFTAPHTGHRIDLGAFSRKRPLNSVTSGTVLG